MSLASAVGGNSGLSQLNAGLMASGQQAANAQAQNNPLTSALANQYALQQGQQQGQYGVQQAQIQAGGQVGAAAQGAQASEYGSGLQYQQAQNQLAFAQQRYNQLFPYFQSLAGQAGLGGSGGASAAGYVPGQIGAPGTGYQGSGAATVAAPPAIGTLGPAISPQQLQANINLNNAQNWSQAQGQSRQATQSLAGGGLGATSPLARALQAQYTGGALQANQAGATAAQMQAAQLNAQQALGAYQAGTQAQAAEYGSQAAAQASQYGSALDYQAALAQVQASRQNAILNALANFSS